MSPLRPITVDVRYLRRPGTGISLVVARLVEEALTGEEPVVLVTDDADHARMLSENYPKAEVVVVPAAPWLWWEQVRLARSLRRIRPTVHVAPANYGIPLLRPRCTGTILILHDLIPLVLWRKYLRPRPLWAAMYLTSLVLAILSADEIVAVSEHSARDLRRLFRRGATVIRPPVPDRRKVGGAARRGRPYVLCHGGLDVRKNVPALLEGFARFSETQAGADHELVLLGSGTDCLSGPVERLGIASRTIRTGFVDDAEKWKWIEGASCVLYPSSYEGFGLVVVEGFAGGVPVVTGTGGALADTGGAAVVAIDPEDPSALARGLLEVTDPVRADELVTAGFGQLEHLRRQPSSYRRVIACAAARRRDG